MKKLACAFKDENGLNIYHSFYGQTADVQAANFMSAHPNYTVVSAEYVRI